MAIYKRCGWEKPVAGFTERDELQKRREYAVIQGANKDALNILDKMSAEYEENYFQGML